ncbi:hypothetical protein D9M72_400120 [compost metagenome]
MKLASGVAANSIAITAAITATNMICTCSVMPTAVMMLSIENTRSSTRIWPMAEAKLCTALAAPPSSASSSAETWWWISRVAFQTRKAPPAIRMMSRHDSPWPRMVNTGSVSLTMKAMVASRPRRITSARLMPILRAFSRMASGSLLVRIEMKIRLSIPSTISMATRVASAAHAAGSCSNANDASMRAPGVRLQAGARRWSARGTCRRHVSAAPLARAV